MFFKTNLFVKWFFNLDTETFFKIFVVRFMYLFGLGDFWFERNKQEESFIFKVCYFLLGYMYVVPTAVFILFELASFSRNLSEEELQICLNYSIAHTLIFLKMINLLAQRQPVKELIKSLLDLKKYHSDSRIDKREFYFVQMYVIGITISSVGTLSFVSIDSAVKTFKYGEVFRTVITYWPDSKDVTTEAFYGRIFFNAYWWIHVTVMLVMDSLVVTTLVMLAHRFRLVQSYFKDIKGEIDENCMKYSPSDMENNIHTAFIKGIRFHNETLWCAKRAQKIWSFIFTCQSVEVACMDVLLLMQIVAAEKSLTALFARFLFLITMTFLLGSYMWSCGDVTFEASRVSDAIYDCGWQSVLGENADMRRLVVLSTQKANIPVQFKALGLFNMSYDTFLSVVKSSYSAFAVLY